MNKQKADNIILMSALFTFGLGFLNSLREKEQKKHGSFPSAYHYRLFVGTGIVFLSLSAISEFAPQFAGPMAALVGTTAVVTNGAPVINHAIALTGYDNLNTKEKKN